MFRSTRCGWLSGRIFSRWASLSPKTNSTDINILGVSYPSDDWTNVTPRIISKIGSDLTHSAGNPLCLLKKQIQYFFDSRFLSRAGSPLFVTCDRFSPVVSTVQNFDNLLVPLDHVSRNKQDSYYLNNEMMLRAHTTAHQLDLIKSGLSSFLIFGDVYRRDEIDATHHCVFHQNDGVRLFTKFEAEMEGVRFFERDSERSTRKQAVHTADATRLVEQHLKTTLLDLIASVLGPGFEHRWVDVYFPFTHPSWELELNIAGEWVEILGCGLIEHEILRRVIANRAFENTMLASIVLVAQSQSIIPGADAQMGWAYGIGLERLAMKLYRIPDIRLFWSTDERFSSQFSTADVHKSITFRPFSKHPPCPFDVSFWIPESGFEPNDFHDLVRQEVGDLAEEVKLFDEFQHPKSGRRSLAYRIVYRSMDRTLTLEEVQRVHTDMCRVAELKLGVEVR